MLQKISLALIFTLGFSATAGVYESNSELANLLHQLNEKENVEEEQKIVGGYSIQVASYPSQNEAIRKLKSLPKSLEMAFFHPVEIKAKTWYRVYVGQFESKEKAQAERKHLMKKGLIKEAIVSHYTNPYKGFTRVEIEKKDIDRIMASKIQEAQKTKKRRYSVRVSAFPSKSEAETEVKILSDSFSNVFYQPVSEEGVKIYQVFIGSFASRAEAKKTQQEYSDVTSNSASVVPYKPR